MNEIVDDAGPKTGGIRPRVEQPQRLRTVPARQRQEVADRERIGPQVASRCPRRRQPGAWIEIGVCWR